jgi:spore coat polysaccharide biosynthesis predicted glycosyltransferase SpsG
MKSLFITNAGPNIGGGHLSRCFALSCALNTLGVDSRWILNDAARPQAAALGITDASYLRDPFSDECLPARESADFAVADSYIPGADFYIRVSERMPLVVVDDLHDRGLERFADILINYGIGANRRLYGDAPRKFLLGPRYALLREEYWRLRPKDGDYTLFTAGASDVLNCSADISSLWRTDMGRLIVVLGPLISEETKLRVLRETSGKRGVEVLAAPDNFASLLARAGFVISSASVTAYEALSLEKKLAVFTAAANQRGFGEILSGIGAAYDLGDWQDVNTESIRDALKFSPNKDTLKGLVNKRGACVCAGEIVKVLGGSR